MCSSDLSNSAKENHGAAPARLEIVDALRGIAALGVCLFHFIVRNNLGPEGVFRDVAAYGEHGVTVFFVISGFVLPFALERSRYRLRAYGHFILKRIIRLDLPYLTALTLAVVLGYAAAATPGFQGPPFKVDLRMLLLHFGYLNVLTDQPWINPAFWTLAIEVQYYLLVGLVFTAVANSARAWRLAVMVGLAVAAWLFPRWTLLPHWLFVFMLGMAAFQFRAQLISLSELMALLILLTAGAVAINGPTIAVAALGASLLIAFVSGTVPRVLLFYGQISYSLYLVHTPVGTRVVNLGHRWATNFPEEMLVLVTALTASTLTAWLLWRWVEQPSIRWASKIRYP